MIQYYRNIQSHLSAFISFPSVLLLQWSYFLQQALQASPTSLGVLGYLAGLILVALIPCPKSVGTRYGITISSLLATLGLLYGQHDLAYGLLLLSSWQMGVRLFKPWHLMMTLLALQASWLTFMMLGIYHIICINGDNPPRLIIHQSKWSKPLITLMIDLVIILSLFAWSVLTYAATFVDASNTHALLALLPIAGGLILAQNIPKPTEFFIYPGYVGLCFIACTIIQISVVYIYSLTLYHPAFTILFIILQTMLLSCLSWVFSLPLHLYQTLRRNQNTSVYDGVLFIGFIAVIITSFSIQQILHTSNNLFYLSWFIIGCMLLTLLRYPAPMFKTFLQVLVYHVFKVNVTGLHHLNNLKKPYIVIANHISYVEPPLLGGLLPGRYMFPINPLAGEMLAVRLTEIFWEKLPMSPDQPMMLKPFIKGLRHGRNGIIFPEGQRNPHTQIGKVFPGVNLAINLTNAKILPIYIEGTQYHVTSRFKSFLPKRMMPRIQVHIGAPITPNPKKRFNEADIRDALIHAKLEQPRPKTLKKAIDELITQVGSQHTAIYATKRKISLKSLMADVNTVKWNHAPYYHCTPDSFEPEAFLSAMINQIPIIIGDPNRISKPKHALYDATSDDVHAFNEAQLVEAVYHWCCYTPIKSTDTIFISCKETSEFRLCLLGFLGSIFMGTPCVIHQSQAFLENLYLEDANVLIASSNQINMLLQNAQFNDLMTLRLTIAMHIDNKLDTKWVKQFKHPLYGYKQSNQDLKLKID